MDRKILLVAVLLVFVPLSYGLENDYFSVNLNQIINVTNSSDNILTSFLITNKHGSNINLDFQFNGNAINYLYVISDERTLTSNPMEVIIGMHNQPPVGQIDGYLFIISDQITSNIPISIDISNDLSPTTTTTTNFQTTQSIQSTTFSEITTTTTTTVQQNPGPNQFSVNFSSDMGFLGKNYFFSITNLNYPSTILLEAYLMDSNSIILEKQFIIDNQTSEVFIQIPNDLESKDYSLDLVEPASLQRVKQTLTIKRMNNWFILWIILGIIIITPLFYYGFIYIYSYYYYHKDKFSNLNDFISKFKEKREEKKKIKLQEKEQKKLDKEKKKQELLSIKESKKKEQLENKELRKKELEQIVQQKQNEKDQKKNEDNQQKIEKENSPVTKEITKIHSQLLTSSPDIPLNQKDKDKNLKQSGLTSFKDFEKDKKQKEKEREEKALAKKKEREEKALAKKKEQEEKALAKKKEKEEKERKKQEKILLKKKYTEAEKYILKEVRGKEKREKQVVQMILNLQKLATKIRVYIDKGNLKKAVQSLQELKRQFTKISHTITEFDIKESRRLVEILEITQKHIEEKRKPIDIVKTLKIHHLLDETKLNDTKLPSFKKFEKDKHALEKLGIKDLFDKPKVKDKPEFFDFAKKNSLLFELENEIEIKRELSQKKYGHTVDGNIKHFYDVLKSCESNIEQKNLSQAILQYQELQKIYNLIKDSPLNFEKKITFFDKVNEIYNNIQKLK